MGQRKSPPPGVYLRRETGHICRFLFYALGMGDTIDPTEECLMQSRQHKEQLAVDPEEELRHKLANANDYFRRKAGEVLNDEDALRLLARLYEAGTLDLTAIDTCKDGIPLAKLTAANFCQIGAQVAYITDSGLRFINSIKDA